MPSDGSGGGRKLRMDRYSVGVWCWSLIFPLSFTISTMSTAGNKRQRSTRLSSGSVKKRSYVDPDDSEDDDGAFAGADSDSEEDFQPEKNKKKNGAKSRGGKRDSPSSDDFSEEEEEDEDEEDSISDEAALVDSEEDEEEPTSTSRKKVKVEAHQEIIEVYKAPKGSSESNSYLA